MTNGTSNPSKVEARFVIDARRRGIEQVQQRIFDAMERCGYEQAARFAVHTAVEEALANAMLHGNRNDPGKQVTLAMVADAVSVVIDVQDEGYGFDPGAVPDPTRPENVDIPSGRGIMLMRAYMTEVEFYPPGNRVRLRYVRGKPRD